MRKTFILILFSLLLNCCSFAALQGKKTIIYNYSLKITQIILPDGGSYEYRIKRDSLFVKEFLNNNKGWKNIYLVKINKYLLHQLESITPQLIHLKNEYRKPMIDGFLIEVEISKNEALQKKIIIDSNSISELDSLFNVINKAIIDLSIPPIIVGTNGP
jgi:hypothetical protein